MNKLAIVGDTCLDLTYEMAEKYDFSLISYYIQMDDRHLVDQIDIQSRTFYQRMENHEVLSTGIPPIQAIIDRLDELKAHGYSQALLICASEKLTGMRQLYEVVKSDYEGMELYIYDSNQVASSAGLLLLYAAQMNREGRNVHEIIEELNRVKDQVHIYALFRTLKYVIKGGRLNKYAGALGTLLNIQPILRDNNGEVGIIDKVRGKKKSFIALVEHLKSSLKDSKRYHLAIFSGNNDEEITMLKEELKELIENAEFYIETELSPVLGVHAGPQSMGVSYLKLD